MPAVSIPFGYKQYLFTREGMSVCLLDLPVTFLFRTVGFRFRQEVNFRNDAFNLAYIQSYLYCSLYLCYSKFAKNSKRKNVSMYLNIYSLDLKSVINIQLQTRWRTISAEKWIFKYLMKNAFLTKTHNLLDFFQNLYSYRYICTETETLLWKLIHEARL